MKKRCSKCKIKKDILNFFKDKRVKSGFYSACKKCHNTVFTTKEERIKYRKEYYKNNREKFLKYQKELRKKYPEKMEEYRKKNKEKIKGKAKEYYQKNKEKLKKYRKEHYDYYREYNKEYRKNNSLKIKDDQRKWCQKNKEKIRDDRKKTQRELRKNPIFKLNSNISNKIWRALSGGKMGRKWESLVGYTSQDLTQHLEKQFNNKMNWGNYGDYWHLDHIVPKSWFPYQTPEEQSFKDCWALANLQPLEAQENWSKNKYLVF